MSAHHPKRRHAVARHGQLTSPHPLARLGIIAAVTVAVLVVSIGSVAGFAVWESLRTITVNAVEIEQDADAAPLPPSIGEIEGGANVLVVGTDSCEGQDIAQFPRCAHDPGGERNDVTMLVHIGDNPHRVTVVSFPRDMLVPIPSCPRADGTGSYAAMSSQMMNASYMYGGLPCTVMTVEALTGIDVQFAAAVRWTGVIEMSDAIGGVEVCVSEDISDRHTGLNLTEGTHTLEGEEALQFLRIRHGIGDGSDLGRISNQQQFMSSLVRKLQSEGTLSDPSKLFSLASTALQQVNDHQLILDKNLADPTRMVQIAMAVRSVPYDEIVFVQYPTTYAADGSHVLPVTSAADVLFDALRANKAIELTGESSQGNGVTVIGEATPTPKPTASATPTATATPGGTLSPTPTPTEAAVELPGSIAGQTAAQVTCTNKEHG
ncbi:LCP family protein [Microbacterium fluvii]|uniref:LCP family protein n=1 Tax=Microbacterium fluvii TaxID=415215 RepID=A0ABW2H7N2_9MICO|nr:LCP family protein [Microbacterium fluvii]MCU4671010.1 LCP family protein [Microbacterium fluvii]